MRQTTASKILEAINQHLVTIDSVQVKDKETSVKRELSSEKLITDLEFYLESGIFADTLDFEYKTISTDVLQVQAGYMSSACDKCIDIKLCLCDGVDMQRVDKLLVRDMFS